MSLKISIITISFNQREYIEECIKSVLDQQYLDLEYIVMDGDSTDGTKEILHAYSDRISKLIIGKDTGPANALNKGLEIATGDIVGFINSDDYLLPGSLNMLSNVISSHPQYDVYYGPGYIKDERNGTYQKIFPTLWNVGCFRAGISVIFQQSIFIRRALLQDKVKFNERNTTHWDGELLVDLDLQKAKFFRHNVSIGVFRIYAGTISDTIVGNAYWQKYLKEKDLVDKRIDQSRPGLHTSKVYWWSWIFFRDFPNLWHRAKRKFISTYQLKSNESK